MRPYVIRGMQVGHGVGMETSNVIGKYVLYCMNSQPPTRIQRLNFMQESYCTVLVKFENILKSSNLIVQFTSPSEEFSIYGRHNRNGVRNIPLSACLAK